jgi:hypothetical protein
MISEGLATLDTDYWIRNEINWLVGIGISVPNAWIARKAREHSNLEYTDAASKAAGRPRKS